ncbi:MAG TPA: HAD hydrolase-like protein [Bryobacteraceae bacterium]|jgi:beta-phosphoglucomutase-like phosphatase (HAD superfamily)|nr:HAD hydrolase-like protein [Bryobacteraceae bacterium]
MQPVKAVLFEPVGCLAEFPAEPFNEIAARFFGGKRNATRSASRAYWHVLNLMEASGRITDEFEAFEVEAVNGAVVFEDVAPALTELKAMGVQLCLTSSLSRAAVAAFLDRLPERDLFSAVWSRDSARGIKEAPLRAAVASPDNTVFLTDTAEGLKTAMSAGLNGVLMMNDPDEARRLAMQNPAGGIVSLLELPDFVRLVTARNF